MTFRELQQLISNLPEPIKDKEISISTFYGEGEDTESYCIFKYLKENEWKTAIEIKIQ